MKILIVGAGAMGCYMGAVLTAAGQDVILYDVDIAKMVLLDCQGIYLEELDGGLQIIRPQTREKIEVIEPVDVVILLVKGYNTYAAAQSIATIADCQPDIISLQNGMGNLEILSERFPTNRLFAGVTYQGAYEVSPGNIIHTGSGKTFIAPLEAQREDSAREYAALLAGSGLPGSSGSTAAAGAPFMAEIASQCGDQSSIGDLSCPQWRSGRKRSDSSGDGRADPRGRCYRSG